MRNDEETMKIGGGGGGGRVSAVPDAGGSQAPAGWRGRKSGAGGHARGESSASGSAWGSQAPVSTRH